MIKRDSFSQKHQLILLCAKHSLYRIVKDMAVDFCFPQSICIGSYWFLGHFSRKHKSDKFGFVIGADPTRMKRVPNIFKEQVLLENLFLFIIQFSSQITLKCIKRN